MSNNPEIELLKYLANSSDTGIPTPESTENLSICQFLCQVFRRGPGLPPLFNEDNPQPGDPNQEWPPYIPYLPDTPCPCRPETDEDINSPSYRRRVEQWSPGNYVCGKIYDWFRAKRLRHNRLLEDAYWKWLRKIRDNPSGWEGLERTPSGLPIPPWNQDDFKDIFGPDWLEEWTDNENMRACGLPESTPNICEGMTAFILCLMRNCHRLSYDFTRCEWVVGEPYAPGATPRDFNP